MTDPISDMLTRIRNAASVGKTEVLLPHSKIKFSLAKILQKEGYLAGVEEVTANGFKALKLIIARQDGKPVVQKLTRVSKPGRRVYAKADELPKVLNDLGIAIISTPNGLMTNKEARKRRLGGEILCEIY